MFLILLKKDTTKTSIQLKNYLKLKNQMLNYLKMLSCILIIKKKQAVALKTFINYKRTTMTWMKIQF